MKTLRERIGGEDGITLAAWAILYPWAIYFSLGYAPNRVPHSLFKWILTGIIAHTLTGVPLLIGKTFILRNKNKNHLIATVFIFFAAGITRAVSVGFFSVALNASTKPNYIPRLSAAIYVTPIWLGLASVVVASVRQHNRNTRALVMKQVALADTKRTYIEQIDQYRSSTKQKINELLNQVLDQAQTSSDVASGLIKASTEIIRPASHAMARQTIILYPPTEDPSRNKSSSHWASLFREMTIGSAFPYRNIALVLFVSPLASLSATFGIIKGLLYSTITSFIFISLQIIGEKLTYSWRRAKPRTIAFIPVIVIWVSSSLGAAGFAKYLYRDIPALSSTSTSFLTLSFFLSVFGSLYKASSALRQVVLSEMEASISALTWEKDRAASIARFEQEKMTQLVHGDIQSSITAAALRIKLKNSSAEEALLELTPKLQNLVESTPSESKLFEGLESIKNVWLGVCDINIDFDHATENVDPYAGYSIMSVVREAFSNSVRHGKATKIQVKINRTDNYWTVLVTDNGRLPKKIRTNGYGSELFNNLSESTELNSANGQTTLKVLIPAVK